jgi:hypothetical protein
MEFQLKLSGVIRDTRAGLYADSPDDDLSKVFFDPREDEDPDFNPEPQSDPGKPEASIPTSDDPDDADAEAADALDHGERVQIMTFEAKSHPPAFRRPVQPQQQAVQRFPDPAPRHFPCGITASSNHDAAPPLRR